MPYPTVEDVLNLARVYINDTFAGATGTVGEGRIFVDSWTPILTILNEAIEHYQRDLEDGGVPSPTMRKEVFVLNSITPVNGPAGLAVGDPAIQQHFGFDGFFDGLTLNASVKLPTDLIIPLEVWQRTAGTTLTFSMVDKAENGLESIYQDFSLGLWEWRGDAIYWNGSLETKDIRIRYTGSTADIPANTLPSAFSTTPITLQDSKEPLAFRCAYVFCQSRLPAGAANDLLQNYTNATNKIINRYVKQAQRTVYERAPYGETGDIFGWFGG